MITIVFGTRPEWIKIKPVVDKIKDKIPFKLICTGQHSSLIDKSINEYRVEFLNIESNSKNRLNNIVSSILDHSDYILNGSKYVMVQGDTTSAFAVALASFHQKVPIIHLEAGLRSWDINNPYPEEFNRIAISNMTTIHLCPTLDNKHNLRRVGGDKYVVGNTVLDSLVDLKPSIGDFVLVTLHRRENIPIISEWFKAIEELANKRRDLKFIIPLHINPNIQKYKDIFKIVRVIEPLSHERCVEMISKCAMVITDSGGVQEESSFLKKKAVVCRKTTERREGQHTFAQLCSQPSELDFVFNRAKIELVDLPCPYGDGKASERIMGILLEL